MRAEFAVGYGVILPTRFPVAKGPVRLCGVMVDLDEETGKATAIERFSRVIAEESEQD